LSGESVKGIKFTRSDEELAQPLLRPLYNDLIECEELLSRADTQFARRTFVRASFAFIEGYIYWLKEEVFKWLINLELKKDFININITAITLLQDAVFYPNKQGKIEQEPNRLPFLNFCAFVLRTAAEHWGMNPESMFSDNGWKELQLALKVRHRITHPKQPQDLEIADVELESVRESHRWLFNCVVDIVNTTIGVQEKEGRANVCPTETLKRFGI
jgi:hypothetical protein